MLELLEGHLLLSLCVCVLESGATAAAMDETNTRTSLTMEDYQKMLATIDSTAKCPVCLERVRSPTTLCNNGHAICRQCKQTQQHCPTCRAPFSRINPVFLNALMDLLPSQCRNSYRGCTLVLDRESLIDHERECRFRMEKCKVRGCSWQDEITGLLDHVASTHPKSFLTSPAVVRAPDFIVSDEEYSASLVAVEDCLFWVHITNNFYKKQIPVIVQWLQRESRVSRVLCDVTVVKDHFSFCYSQTLDSVEPVEQALCSTLAKQFLVTPNSIFPNFISSKYEVEIRFEIRLECDK
ncbi:E3 ubiquitin-protein ligase sina-like [Macrosteles quadrilineatus]|uniref:E3 ubiquitin-protein ligase sina-like n=1 Tax=Macrosteles quadrilineatus TaxID=74068 RepID=UPI0023E23496|nr:E3 ubiquitin-protein ligase sina-like [Macrosteles quadrilineatus]